jgi:hypothetical protein
MTYLEGQIIQRQAYITLWSTRILSGAYKTRKIFREDTELSDEEKLADAMATLLRHVKILGELVEHLPGQGENKEKWEKISGAVDGDGVEVFDLKVP